MAASKIHHENEMSTFPLPASDYTQCGYPIHSIETYDEKWKCIYCQLIIKEPIQLTECGHRSCKGCYEGRAAATTEQIMVCPEEDCSEKFDKTAIMVDRAFKRELNVLKVNCCYKNEKNCSWEGPLQSYQEHLDKAHVHFSCDKCPEQFSTIQAFNDHKEKNCTGRFQLCPLGSACSSDLIRIDALEEHYLSEKHQEAMALILVGEQEIPETADQHEPMEASSDNNEIEQEISNKLSEVADKVQKLNDETVQLGRDFVRLNETYQIANVEVTNFQTAAEERNAIMSHLQPKQDSIQKEVEQLKQSLEENQHVSMDGTLTWRIDRVAERMADAQSDRQPSIYSAIFYSGPNGYKMRARLYLYGDGNARRTHMSLFFLLMKGEYDALLVWPFSYKVTFCLFDQTGSNRHIIDSFRPDVKSTSFQRPKTDANIASGIPKFFPLPMIQQDDNAYVREDTMFLKIIVDLNDTPKVVLPYMLTLNPGLPNHIQQYLINIEKNKRQQQANANPGTPTTTIDGGCG